MIAGRPAPVVGRVSMDSTTIDLGDIPAAIGDEVTVIDPDPVSPASVYALAKWSETIPYEILSRIGPHPAGHYGITIGSSDGGGRHKGVH